MSLIDILRLAAIGLSVVVIIAGLTLIFVGPERLESLFSEGELPEVDFKTLKRPDSPNSYLVCPPDSCGNAEPDETAPIFDIPPSALRAKVLEFVDRSPDIRTHRMDLEANRFDFVERTPAMRFPDVITVKIFDRGGGGSTLAIYSRSVYGHSDLGANKRRVRRWLAVISD